MPPLTYIYIASILIAFLSSLTSFRLGFSFHLKMFSCLLGLTFLVEVTAAFVAFHLHKPNNRLYNTFTLIEFWTYGYFYLYLLQSKILRRILLYFLVIFPIFWLVTVLLLFGFGKWNSYVIIVGSFFSVLFALLYYYEIITAREILSLGTLPEFWIATGMLIFYLGALPFFGMLNYLVKYNEGIAKSFLVVYQVLDTLMYTLFTYAFLCRIRNTKKSLSS